MPHMIGIVSPAQAAELFAFQNASASFSQSPGGDFSLPPGALLPPARIDPNLYFRASSGVTAEMSGWVSWATFSLIVMPARLRTAGHALGSAEAAAGAGSATGAAIGSGAGCVAHAVDARKAAVAS